MKVVGIAGVGFVGNAVKSFFETRTDVVCYDKFKDCSNIENLLSTDMIFLCLPTLYNDKINEYDKSAIYEVCNYLNENMYKGIVIVKSTVEPETTEYLSYVYNNLQFIHNPEFLTARTAVEDFAKQEHIIIGRSKRVSDKNVKKINDFFKKHYPKAILSNTTSTESECVKSFCNCFGASKVMLFNEYYLLCQKIGLDFNKVRDTMLKNNWINPMHTDIPGPDGNLGFGGACFPKDTRSLNAFMEKKNTPHQVLNSVIKECDEVRK